jgi:uncharacterized membrane protein
MRNHSSLSMARKHYIRFTKTAYDVADTVPLSAIYECSECENITAYKKGERFTVCENCQGGNDQQWYRTNELLHFVTKNLNTEFDRVESIGLKISDIISQFSGSIAFVIVHIFWFWAWIHMNTGGALFGISNFDPYPFGLLTMIVSLEAIILSTFILITQNRQSQKSELRAELDYQTNLDTEKTVAEILVILKEIREEGHFLNKKASEILEDTTQITEPDYRVRRQKKQQNTADMLHEAGIRVVRNKKRKP